MTKPANAGRSILEIIKDMLDDRLDDIMSGETPESWVDDQDPDPQDPDPVGSAEEWENWGNLRGTAWGLAYAVAVIENPYEVSVPRVRQEAMERWKERNRED